MAAQMAEYATLAVLAAHRDARAYAAAQRDARWAPGPRRARRISASACWGSGCSGRRWRAALSPFGFPLHGWSRAPQRGAGRGLPCAGAAELPALPRALAGAGLPAAVDAATRGLLDRAALRCCRRRQVVNAGRGDLVVDADLLALLDKGHLGGATLDVFREEPLPPAHPFWHHPRVTITPHVSAVTDVDARSRRSPPRSAGSSAARRCPASSTATAATERRNRPHDRATFPLPSAWSRSARATACRTSRSSCRPTSRSSSIERLADAGLPAIEATAFVSPKWVPQMADAAEVMARIRRQPGVRYPVLAPEPEGLRGGARRAAPTRSRCSSPRRETFSQRNINCSIAESLERFAPVVAAAQRARRARARLHLLRARLPVRGRRRPRARSRDVAARAARRWAATRSRSATPSASARRPDAGADRGGRRARPGRRSSPATSTTPTARRSPTSTRRCEMGVRHVRLLGRGPRRLPVRQGRDRQRRQRGRRLPAAGARHRDRAST